MEFSSISFIFYFLPLVLLIYYLVKPKRRNIVLLIASLIFYFYGEPKYVFLMLLSILNAYIFALLISKNKENKYGKIYFIISIIISILLLVYFKYIDFLISNLNTIFNTKFALLNVLLPIGISFYTFQSISYLVDVYKERVPVEKSFLKLATYISLFPQLIAGPIVRYQDIENSLNEGKVLLEDFAIGVRRFIIGLGKKIMIANVLGELINAFTASNEKSVLFFWLYALANMLQIYFDFSGYSDMAIGLGHMFGFNFPENFNYPYIATSITDFWRRWHMTLSTWFKDYVYIPLGGNRVAKIKYLRNILIVWLLTGLWHGAEWNFIIWGLYFGILLIIEKEFLLKYLKKLPKIIGNIYTLFIVLISFIIFSGTSFQEIIINIKGLFGNGHPLASKESIYYLKSYLVPLTISLLGATPLLKTIFSDSKIKKVVNILEPIFLLFILIICISYLIDGSFNPFLYFRF